MSGPIALPFVIEAADAREVDGLVENLSIWPRMITEVRPLTTFGDRAAALRPRLDGLRKRLSERRGGGVASAKRAPQRPVPRARPRDAIDLSATERPVAVSRARPLADQTGSGA